jgi:hypothetical protein
MCAAPEVSRTAYFDDFEETMANLANTTEMLKAVVQMIEGARGRID